MKTRNLVILLVCICLIVISFKACNYYFTHNSPIIESFEKLKSSIEGDNASLRLEISSLNSTIAKKIEGHKDSIVYTQMLDKLNGESDKLIEQIDSLLSSIETNRTSKNDKNLLTELMIDEKNGEKLKYAMSSFRQTIAREMIGRGGPLGFVCDFELKEIFEEELYEDPLISEKKLDQTWEKQNFYKMPTIPGTTLIMKMKKDILVAQLTCLETIDSCLSMNSR